MKNINSKILGLIVLACFVLGFSSCKKTEAPKQEPEQVTTPAEPCEVKVEPEAAVEGGELVAIPLVLPKPMFVGTPGNIQGVENLEKPLGHARPDFLAPEGTVNVALGKPIASTDDMPIIGEIAMITDGDKEAAEGSYVELGPFEQHVTIDLEQECDIYAVVVWHYHRQSRVYFDVIVQVSSDPEFAAGVTTIFNNDHDNTLALGVGSDMNYVETAEGKLIDAKGVKGRYVRLYSNGSNSSELNHYIEVEVYGKTAK